MRLQALRLICFMGILLFAAPWAAAGLKPLSVDDFEGAPRLALVIGAGDYQHLNKLKGANDARLIGDALRSVNFDVTLVTDPTLADAQKAIADFTAKVAHIDKSPIILLYLTAQATGGRAYFIDENPNETKTGGIEIRALLEQVASAHPFSLNILMVDTEYEHVAFGPPPVLGNRGALPSKDTSVEGRTLVFVSASKDTKALDVSRTDPEHGPFALAIAARLAEPGLRLRKFMLSVRFDVAMATDEQQFPQLHGIIDPGFYFRPPDVTAANNAAYRAASVVYEDENGELRTTYEDGSFALLVGESDYDDAKKAWADLPSVKSELEELGRVLQDLHGFSVTYLFDPKGSALRDAVEAFVNEHGQKRNARLLIMLSGHGETATVNNKKLAWFVPSDAPRLNDGRGPFNSVALSMRRIEEWSETMEAKHVLWLFDSCFSGAALRMTGKKSSGEQAYAEFLHSNAVRRVITAGSENEVVPAESRFTRRLIDVLKGEAKVGNGDQLITGDEIGQFLREDLITFTRRQGLKPQTPQNDTIVIPDEEGDIVFQIEPSLLSATAQ